MKSSVYEWKLPEVSHDDVAVIESYLEAHQLPKFLGKLLFNRQILTEEQLDDFLFPDLNKLHDPFLMNDMKKGVERIQQAIEHNEKILIYGDYDCDGVTSTSVMKEALEMMGAEPEIYIPNRFVDGYGPNLDVFKYFVTQGVNVIITVDNGIAGFEAIDHATKNGVDVIVTDHHEIQDQLPNAYALIHPRLGDSYPFGDLAGVGVAFKVATALLGELPVELLDLTTIGTIGDLVELKDENRIIVRQGLTILQQTDRIGLRALAETAGIDLNRATEETVGFAIAPRLNSLGRLGEAKPAVELLTTFDDMQAMTIAQEIEGKNKERQELVAQISNEALAMVDESPIQIIAKEGWNEGVLGIVASRLVEQTGKPAFVLSINPETGVAKGSGRSIGEANLFKLLQKVDADLLRYGGHHMAAGLSVDIDKLADFKAHLNQVVSEEKLSFKNELMIDGVLAAADISIEHIEELRLLAPYGTGNPLPYFEVKPQSVDDLRLIGADSNHLKGMLTVDDEKLPFICFNFADSKRELISSPQIQMVGQLDINEWNGNRTPQFKLVDYQVKGIQLFDGRAQRFMQEDFIDQGVVFIYFNQENLKKLQKMLPQQSFIFFEDYIEQGQTVPQVVLMDIPLQLDDLSRVIQAGYTTRFVMVFHSFEEIYLNGMPSREQFGRLFRFIAKNTQVDVRYKLQQVSQFVKIPVHVLTFMIKVFADLQFVRIEDGVMYTVENPEKHPLDSSKLYQQRESLIKIEEFLIYSDIETLETWFQQQEENF